MQQGAIINSVLLNFYEEPHHKVNYHQDNEEIFGPTPEIFSLSFYGDRKFILGPKENMEDKKNKISVKVTSGSLLIMSGSTQIDWFHKVEKKTHNHLERINATFRLTV